VKAIEFFVEFRFAEQYGYIHHSCKCYQPLRVYGDDIIIDSSLSTTLIEILAKCGFEVNKGKSFVASNAFRESCGGYYFRGFDVTPLRYTLSGQESSFDARFAASSIALSNRAGDYAYFNVKRYAMQCILFGHGHKRPFLFSTDRKQSYAFYSDDPVNDHLVFMDINDEIPTYRGRIRRMYRGCHAKDYQRQEVCCYSFMYEDSRDPEASELEAYDSYLYMRWWAKQRYAAIDSPFDGSAHRVTAGCRLRKIWTPS